MRVAILGSRPEPDLPFSDQLFVANAAGRFNPDLFSRTSAVHLVGRWPSIREMLDEPEASARLRSAGVRSITLWNPKAGSKAQAWNRQLSGREREIRRRIGLSGSLAVMSVDQRRALWESQSGLCEPVTGPMLQDLRRTPHAVSLRVQHSARVARAHLEAAMRQHAFVRPITRPELRPSTGVMALSVAISRFGATAEYCLAGIGLAKRGVYRFAGIEALVQGDPAANPPSRWIVAPHINADRLVLQRLGVRYRISTTEPELANLCGLELDREARRDLSA